jgi:protein gp37
MATAIEWTDKTWNPIIGCSKLSAGCQNCYAVTMANRLAHNPSTPQYAGLTRSATTWAGVTRLVDGALADPLKWRKPQHVFVGSMTDLFHDATPFTWIDRVFAAMAMCPQHTFQLLTKRPERMLAYFNARTEGDPWAEAADEIADLAGIEDHPFVLEPSHIPLSNVWLGVTVEDQDAANERIPLLLKTPASMRFISCEPLLGRVGLTNISTADGHSINALDPNDALIPVGGPKLNWTICGAETGPKKRPMDPAWARDLRDQCVSAGVPFFFKKGSEGRRELDGKVWEQFPTARKAATA